MLNNEQYAAVSLIESGASVFITGKAGTGKSFVINTFLDQTAKRVVVLAPTGLAAINVGGQTIHSYFKLGGGGVLTKRDTKKVNIIPPDTIIIDEVSMVRADLMDAVNWSLQKIMGNDEAFGGVQMIFVGDLAQLPPVVTKADQAEMDGRYKSPYFFSAEAFDFFTPIQISLENVFRQANDEVLKSVLNEIRDGRYSYQVGQALERCVISGAHRPPQNTIYLTTINKTADDVNRQWLHHLGEPISHFKAQISGAFSDKEIPAPMELSLCKGARVMFTKNDPEGRWVNGTLGTVTDIVTEKDEELDVDVDSIWVMTDETLSMSSRLLRVPRTSWEKKRYLTQEEIDANCFCRNECTCLKEDEPIPQKVIGSFRQYPLKLAWAITMHKSQGQTFDRCVVDMGNGAFTHGQTYVALSRCRSLDGLFLTRALLPTDIKFDHRVLDVRQRFDAARPVQDLFGQQMN